MLMYQRGSHAHRGLSLVELMVGIAVGLLVVAGASLLVSSQLSENRRLLLETQVQQDLRATADIIARELRRSGHWRRAETGVANASVGSATRNDFMSVGSSDPDSTQCSGPLAGFDVCFNYLRVGGAADPDNAVSGPGYTFGYKLADGVIKTKLSSAAPEQDLTDSKVLYVESLSVDLKDPLKDPASMLSMNDRWARLPCPKLCPGDTTDCWPMTAVRDVMITITGYAVSDRAVRRTVVSQVRLRNDQFRFAAGAAADYQACPA